VSLCCLNTGNIRLFLEENADIGIDIRLFYPEGTPAATRDPEASSAGTTLAQNANTPRYLDGVREAVQESGTELNVDVTSIVDEINDGTFAQVFSDSIESEAIDDGAFALKAGAGALLASVAAAMLLV